MVAPAIPSISAGGGGPSSAGATTGAYGAESAGGAWIINQKGSQTANASSGGGLGSVNWLMVGGVALVGLFIWRRGRK
ncbi:MAG: hypothetical protein WAQ08_05850 [Aquabacterium sp.]|uniref:hypothetical protein n=1 Tax=Aquabacterium sp. TaxID=1872578 RepID=UPI003BB1C31F